MSGTCNARDFAKYLDHHGAVERKSGNNNARVFVLPNGAEAWCPLKGYVNTVTLKKAAAAMGKTYAEMRADMGSPILVAHKPPPGAAPPKRSECSKGDVLKRIASARSLLTDLEHVVRPGIRDSAFYGGVMQDVVSIRGDIERVVNKTKENHPRA